MKSIPVIGLCGGIASGKTKVGELLKKLGGHLINADKIGHQVIQLNPAKKALSRWFGRKIFTSAGRINHSALAGISFAAKRNIRKLNNLVHPIIKKRIFKLVAADKNKKRRPRFILLDAALLIESGLSGICDTLVCVDATKRTRLERARLRRGWSNNELNRREKFQLPLGIKKQKANFIIDNNGVLRRLKNQVKDTADFIIELSKQ